MKLFEQVEKILNSHDIYHGDAGYWYMNRKGFNDDIYIRMRYDNNDGTAFWIFCPDEDGDPKTTAPSYYVSTKTSYHDMSLVLRHMAVWLESNARKKDNV